MFDEQGAEGWEIATVFKDKPDYYIVIFKRPKTETLTKVIDDMIHRCQIIIESPGKSDYLKYHSSATPNQSYHYLALEDRCVWIGYCPWCGDDI